MMTEVAQNLKVSDRPVVKKIFDENGTKIMAIDFNTEMESKRFARYESYDIPMNVKHSVVAWDDAIFLLFLNEKNERYRDKE